MAVIRRVVTGLVIAAAVVSAILLAPSVIFPVVCGVLAGALLLEFFLLLKKD